MTCRYCFKKQLSEATFPPLIEGIIGEIENNQKQSWWSFNSREDVYHLLATLKRLPQNAANKLLISFLQQNEENLLNHSGNRRLFVNFLTLVANSRLTQQLKKLYFQTGNPKLRSFLINVLADLLPSDECLPFFSKMIKKETTNKSMKDVVSFYQKCVKPNYSSVELGKLWEELLDSKNPQLDIFFGILEAPRLPAYLFSEKKYSQIMKLGVAVSEITENQVLTTGQYPPQALSTLLQKSNEPRQHLLMAHYFDDNQIAIDQLTITEINKLFHSASATDWQNIPGLEKIRQDLFLPKNHSKLQGVQNLILKQKNTLISPLLLQKLFLEAPSATETFQTLLENLSPLPDSQAALDTTLRQTNFVCLLTQYTTALALAEQQGQIATAKAIKEKYFDFLCSARQQILTDPGNIPEIAALEKISDFYRHYLSLHPDWLSKVTQLQQSGKDAISFLDLVTIHSQKEGVNSQQLIDEFSFTKEQLQRDCRIYEGSQVLAMLRKSPSTVNWLLDQVEQNTEKGEYLLNKMFLSGLQEPALSKVLVTESLFPLPAQNLRFFNYILQKMPPENFAAENKFTEQIFASCCLPEQIPLLLNWGEKNKNANVISVAAQIKNRWQKQVTNKLS